MRILLNLNNLKIGGGIQVGCSFLHEIRFNRDNEFLIVLSPKLSEIIKTELFPQNFVFFTYEATLSIIKSINGVDRFLSKLENDYDIDIVFTLFGPSYWRPKSRHICGFAKSQYIYKDSPFFKEVSAIQKLVLKFKESLHLYSFRNHADAYITENENVSQQLKLLVKNKPVFTVTNTYNQVFNQPKLWERSIKLEPFKGTTLLTITANYPHKNLKIIPKIIEYLQIKYPEFNFRFVISVNYKEIKHLKRKHLNHLVFIGKINITQCPFLYQQADIMFLPTLLECFSASYPEAMKMKVPIITTDLAFARGICNNAALYFNPLSPKDAGEKIFSLSHNPQQVEALKLNGEQRLAHFETPESRAKKYIQIITNEANNSVL